MIRYEHPELITGQRSPSNPLIVEALRDYGHVDARGMGLQKTDHSAVTEAKPHRAGIHCHRGSSTLDQAPRAGGAVGTKWEDNSS